MDRSNCYGFNFWRNVRLGSLIMYNNNNYYEPDDYDDRTDEIEELTWQLMKPGSQYDPKTYNAVTEAFCEMDKEMADALQDAIDTNNYELIGRKVMGLAFDYMERFAKQAAEDSIND